MVHIHMTDHIEEVIDVLEELISQILSTPAACELFDED